MRSRRRRRRWRRRRGRRDGLDPAAVSGVVAAVLPVLAGVVVAGVLEVVAGVVVAGVVVAGVVVRGVLVVELVVDSRDDARRRRSRRSGRGCRSVLSSTASGSARWTGALSETFVPPQAASATALSAAAPSSASERRLTAISPRREACAARTSGSR